MYTSNGMNKVVYVIFGSTGDLTYRKLMPSFIRLRKKGFDHFEIVAIGRHDYTNETYFESVRPWLNESEEVIQDFEKIITYYRMEITKNEDYPAFLHWLHSNNPNVMFIDYLAVAPDLFIEICDGLRYAQADLVNHRVMIEKPFGTSVENVKAVNHALTSTFGEHHIYRIDHYLGKEMAKNIVALRFANPMFQGFWRHEYIERIEIEAKETLGIMNRGRYYEESGAMKDMVQSHLFQLLSLLLMEEHPTHQIRSAQAKVLHHLLPIEAEDIVLGQYLGYRQEPYVDPESMIETFALMRLYVDLPRYKGIPIYLMSGKKLSEKKTMIKVYFKKVQNALYQQVDQPSLDILIDPDEGIVFHFNLYNFNSDFIEQVEMDYCQSCRLDYHEQSLEAYEYLLMEAAKEHETSFTDYEFVVTSWKYMDEVRKKRQHVPLVYYENENDLQKSIQKLKNH